MLEHHSSPIQCEKSKIKRSFLKNIQTSKHFIYNIFIENGKNYYVDRIPNVNLFNYVNKLQKSISELLLQSQ